MRKRGIPARDIVIRKYLCFFQFVVYQAKSGSGDRVDNAHMLATN